jgi:hypothetical protein
MGDILLGAGGDEKLHATERHGHRVQPQAAVRLPRRRRSMLLDRASLQRRHRRSRVLLARPRAHALAASSRCTRRPAARMTVHGGGSRNKHVGPASRSYGTKPYMLQ